MNKQNKNNLVDDIAVECGLSKKEVKKVINLFIQKIKTSLLLGEKILLKGFVTFSIREAKPKLINDFQNEGHRLTVGERKLPKAKFSDGFVKQIKKK
jgi:DNA-binding protein HU-beta